MRDTQHEYPTHNSIQRSLSAVQVLRGDSNSSLVGQQGHQPQQPGIPRADSSLPPLSELSPSGKNK